MARFLFNLYIFATVMGLFPLIHPMQTMHGDEMTISHQSNMGHGNAGKISMESCCDAIAPFYIGCGFLVPQYACIDFFGGSKRLINSNPLFQSIYIEILTPPPKA